MSLDLSQFYQAFFDEADELLAEMERLLLALDPAEPAVDDLHAIFRAAHSIKGGAAAFGFSELRDVTHRMETYLDALRHGEIRLGAPGQDLLLQAGDALKAMLAIRRLDPTSQAHADVVAQWVALLTDLPAQWQQQSEAAEGGAPAAAAIAQLPAESDTPAKDLAAAKPVVYQVAVTLGDTVDVDATRRVIQACQMIGDVLGIGYEAQRTTFGLRTVEPLSAVHEVLEFIVPLSAASVDRLDLDDPVPSPKVIVIPDQTHAPALPSAYPPTPPDTAEPSSPPTASTACAAPAATASSMAPKPPPSAASKPAAPAPSAAESSVRVPVDKIDVLINLVGELVIAETMIADALSKPLSLQQLHERLHAAHGQLARHSRDLQDAVMSIRMMPVSYLFSRFPRMVRDLAQQLGKQVALVTEGEGTELDKGILEKVIDPLTHLVRNAIDHGLETPEQRHVQGKSAVGTITLRAMHQGGQIVLEIADDGAGLNRARILAKACAVGLLPAEFAQDPGPAVLPDAQVWAQIFEPGFSTAQQVTDLSGRGVGMDVVRRNIESLGGRVSVTANAGFGTTVRLHLPLTLAIVDGMVIGVADHRYVVPLASIVESLQPRPEDIRVMAGSGPHPPRVLQIRGAYLPIVSLAEVFGLTPIAAHPSQGMVVVLEQGNQCMALLVDTVLGQQQAVIKSLETNFRKVAGVSGATIMGDGQVAMILDVAALFRASHLTTAPLSGVVATNSAQAAPHRAVDGGSAFSAVAWMDQLPGFRAAPEFKHRADAAAMPAAPMPSFAVEVLSS